MKRSDIIKKIKELTEEIKTSDEVTTFSLLTYLDNLHDELVNMEPDSFEDLLEYRDKESDLQKMADFIMENRLFYDDCFLKANCEPEDLLDELRIDCNSLYDSDSAIDYVSDLLLDLPKFISKKWKEK